jgi:dTDP-4-dehydrorhamnose reductase
MPSAAAAERQQARLPRSLEVWGGVECTINRVRDQFFSQLDRNGHAARADDLELIASLGVRAVRYPVLWERTAPAGLDCADWSWPDARLPRLRELSITPIAGLVHHGSGPPHTSLVDPRFAEDLARYARAVAERYPWLEWYTPVNEPLTTARFSALYGVWYPHARDLGAFKDALLNQCRATVLSMQEIRRINPAARLVQTDDLGKIYSTPLLAYQANFQNQMRWLTWDLLCGRVRPEHPLWTWLTRDCGATESELTWFADHPCPPDLIGVNHYITSERYLDENVENYPEAYRGGNGRHHYADIETARCFAHPTGGLKPLLCEAWDRYGIPVAITEAHIDSNRDDQLRWLMSLWRAAEAARDAGADVRAVTFWALFGSFDWNCLVQECRGYYEPGAFDVRTGTAPRATAVARLMRALAAGRAPRHPVFSTHGWWVRREDRHYCPPVTTRFTDEPLPEPHGPSDSSPVLICGGTGTLGNAFARLCSERGLDHHLLCRTDLDIADASSIERAMDRYQPWALINAAGYVRVDDAERDVERCFRENAHGPAQLAASCARHGVRLVTFSTDLVFDGRRQEPYVESDSVAPLNVYGRSKAEAEARVLDMYSEALVVRTSAFFGPWDQYNYITVLLRALREGREFHAACDMTISPTYVPDLVHACLDLLIDEENGIWHLANSGAVTWADLARQATELAGVDASKLQCCRSDALGWIARRPAFSVLRSARCTLMPSLGDALTRYIAHTVPRHARQ